MTHDISLRGSYSEAEFAAAVQRDLELEQPLGDIEAALARLSSTDSDVRLIWHDFHGASVGGFDTETIAAKLREAAHANARLRLVFYDEEKGGQ